MSNIKLNPKAKSAMLFGNQAEQRKKGGKDYLVVPGVPVREQVMNTYLLPAEEIQAYINVWNGTPVSIGHAQANGGSVKVPEPDVPIIGSLFNVEWDEDNKRMLAEYWIDIQEAMKHNGGKTILENIRNGKMIETSTAYWADEEFIPGNFNGRDYKSIHRNTRPDHIAIFADQTLGACSIENGCGVNRNMKQNKGQVCGCGCGIKQNTALPPFQKCHLPTEMLVRFAFDSGYRTPEQLDKTNSFVEKNGITKPVWLQCFENGDYKILDGAHRIQLAHEFDYDQVPVNAVDEELNAIDLETIYYKWEHDMDRSYLNASMRMDHGKPKKKKKKFVYKGKTFRFSDTIWLQGGKGSGFHGHKGRPGQEGGSSAGTGTDIDYTDNGTQRGKGSKMKDWEKENITFPKSFNEVMRETNSEAVAYATYNTLRDIRSGKDPTQSAIDNIEDQNLYGSRKDVVALRHEVQNLLEDYGVVFEEKKMSKYERSQFDDEG